MNTRTLLGRATGQLVPATPNVNEAWELAEPMAGKLR